MAWSGAFALAIIAFGVTVVLVARARWTKPRSMHLKITIDVDHHDHFAARLEPDRLSDEEESS